MNSFQFREGSSELLPFCDNLWDSFIQTQSENTGKIDEGIKAYLQGLRDGDLLTKTVAGKLHIQLVDLGDVNQAIGFCLTSLSSDGIGEIEALYVLEEYQGNHLSTKIIHNALQWLRANNVVEKRLKVVVGKEAVFSFYQKFQFHPVYTGLYGL